MKENGCVHLRIQFGVGAGRGLAALLAASVLAIAAPASADTNFWAWAETPTMGWNSWDYYGTSIDETQTKAQTDYMEANLLSHGWDLMTVDIQWYRTDPNLNAPHQYGGYNFNMDDYGRLLPATNRFPSATGGMGFKPLADYVHSKGLRFGIHIMRGIPRIAYDQNLPILGTSYTAQDIADTSSTCSWNPDMYGVDMTKPGAQEYFDSLLNLYASWDVDFIKIDDLSRPYHQAEIEGYRAAIDQCGREIVFSTSPGATPVAKGAHVMQHANQWRISDDFWDTWTALYEQFQRLHDWTPYRGPGHFPDADMLPLGVVVDAVTEIEHSSYFTANEQYTLMSLWAIARSPLIHGGDMTQMDAFTLSLLTNDDVITVNQQSTHNRQLFRNGDRIAWVADAVGSSDKYLAVFNTSGLSTTVPVDLAELGYNGDCTIRSLWDQTDLGTTNGIFSPTINSHGAALYRLSGDVVPTPWLSDISSTSSGISISWEAIDSAVSYNVKRALSETGTFTTVASGVTDTYYTDTAVTNGVAYYYAVSAMVGGQESPDSNIRHEVLIIPASQARIISWNYNRYSDSPTGSSPTAGMNPVAAPYWNDTFIDGASGSSMSDVRDNTGMATIVDISWNAAYNYSIQGSHPGADSDGTLNKEVLNGYLNDSSSSVTLSQIPYASYDIYVYFSSDAAGRQGNVTDGTSKYYFNTLGAASIASGNAVFVQATNTTQAGHSEACNYTIFRSLSGTEQTVVCNIPDYGGIAAVQLVGRLAPVINSLSVTNGTVMLNWTADTYGTYQIQSKSNLVQQSAWIPMSGAVGLNGGSGVDIGFPLGSDHVEFYRVQGE